MNAMFSEHRMLAQRAADAPRSPEQLPSGDQFREVLSRLEKGASEFMRNALSPENRAQFNRIVEGFNKEFNQVKDQLMADIRREIPNIRNYFRLGGPFGREAAGVRWNPADNRLTFDGSRPGLNGAFSLEINDDGFTSFSATDADGGTDIGELYGDGDDYPYAEHGGYAIDTSGMQALLAETRTINERLSKERSSVLSGSLAKLNALRGSIDASLLGQPQPETSSSTTPAPATETTPRPNTEPGVTVDPATGERRVGNVPLRPGETPDQLRSRLNQELSSAQTAFNEQRDIVRKLVADGAAEDRIKPERDKLRDLQLALTAAEGQIKGLEGLAQPDRP